MADAGIGALVILWQVLCHQMLKIMYLSLLHL